MSHKLFKSRFWEGIFPVWVVLVLILSFGAVLMAPSPVGAATWYVDGTLGTDDGIHGTGPGTNAFKTIQYAINDARVVDSDIINVAAGTYNEDIQINKGLTIQSSEGAANTIIRGNGVGTSYYMIRIYHSDVTLDGFTVTNPDYQGGADACGILVGNYLGASVNNTHILNNIITEVRNGTGGTPSNYGATGINIGRGAPSNIIISGNVIENIHNPDGASNDHTCGINVWDNGNIIEISSNRISDIKYNGILLQYANNIQVKSNTVTQCQVGVKIDPYTGAVVSGVTVSHNIIVGNSDYGVDNHDPNLVNAANNWWGCNNGPGIIGPGNGDKVSSNVSYDPWLVLNLCANLPSIPADGVSTSIIIADMNKNSDGQDTSAQGHITDGTQIIFTADEGSITSPTITNIGSTTTVFTSSTNPSQATISARAPTCYTCATASVAVNMHAPLPPVGGGVGVSPCEWTEYSNNPVFGQWLGYANRAYYPKVIYDISQFSGHGESAYYKMWFNSDNGIGGGYSIGYAYSDNGTSWTGVINPVNGLAQSPGHPLVEYDPDGFGHNVYYKMWYWDEGASIYTIDTLRYAESNDGINWLNDQPLTQDNTFKLVTGLGAGWNRGSYGPCDLVYNASGSSSLDDCNIWNNKYVMYYMGTDGGNEFIGLAYSDNGTHWKRYGNDPVLSPGAAGDWDNTGVGYCTAMNISGIWQMWYGGGPSTNYGIGYAISSDGVNWTKHPYNPIFHRDDGEDWRNNRTYTPWVLHDADNFSGHGGACPYKMWFSGRSSTGAYSIGYACAIPLIADAGPNRAITSGGSTEIGGSPTASGGMPPYTYNWTPTTSLNDSTIANPIASPTTTNTYIVTVTDSKGCTDSDNVTISVQLPPPSPPAGGYGSSLPAQLATCSATLAADMQGNITTVSMTKDGVLCDTCLAKDTANKYTLEIDKDARVTLAGNMVPMLLTFRESSATTPTDDNTVLVSPVYEFNAYADSYETTPYPITISPPARLILTYDAGALPQNTTEVFIANYDTQQGWLALSPVPGAVAEIGKAHGLLSHFSLFAVIARLQEPPPAKFEASNLSISPLQAQLNQEITISLNISNTGGKSGDYSLELKVDGNIKSNRLLTVAAGSSQTATFTLIGDTEGKHQVEIAGLLGEFETSLEDTLYTKWRSFAIAAFIILVLLAIIMLALIIRSLISTQNR